MRPDRRTVLRRAGLGGIAAVAGLAGTGGLTTGCGGRPAGRPRPPGTAAEAPWDVLARRLDGRLVRPADAGYPTARLLFDPAFDAVRPRAVAFCATPADVAACVSFCRDTGLHLAARCGGHSYGGYSTTPGLVVDVSRMNRIRPGDAGTATVGAGARLVDVYATLAAAGQAIPAGSCPTVGVAGLALGGGIGVLARRHGLTCDRMIGAEVVLASGEALRVDADHDGDLFWALRGAGGGNFGIVTSFGFATHRTRRLGLFTLRWPWSAAAAVLAGWQDWVAGRLGELPDELWTNLVASSTPSSGTSGTPALQVGGVYGGTLAALQGLLGGLVEAVGVEPGARFAAERDHLDAMLIEAGCSGAGVAACHLPSQQPAGTLRRVAQLAASAFVTSPVPTAGLDALRRAMEDRQRTPGLGGGGFILDSWGGAINRVAPAETAFVHRRALASIQYVAGYAVGDPDGVRVANRSWLRGTVRAVAPYVSTAAYQNYIDPELADWPNAYYGTNLPRLRKVKARYDPDNLFHFAQSIS
jgi:FAD/FMN-containing dehydrogenase